MGEKKDVTMWSESLFDGLYMALRKDKGDAMIVGILKEIKGKGYSSHRIISLVNENVSPAAGHRVQTLLSGRPTPKSAGKAGAGAKSEARKKAPGAAAGQDGLVGWLKGLFRS